MNPSYSCKLAKRFRGNLTLLRIGRILQPNRSYQLSHADTLDPETARAIKDGRLEITSTLTHKDTPTPPPTPPTPIDYSHLLSQILQTLQAIHQDAKITTKTTRARTPASHTTIREERTPLLVTPPQRPKRMEAVFTETPQIKDGNVTIEAKAGEGVLDGVETLKHLRGKR